MVVSEGIKYDTDLVINHTDEMNMWQVSQKNISHLTQKCSSQTNTDTHTKPTSNI